MASAYHVGAAALVDMARRRRLDSDLDERSFSEEVWSLGEKVGALKGY